MMSAFNLPAYPTSYFSHQVLTVCPNCGKQAQVYSDQKGSIFRPYSSVGAKCTCLHCGFTRSGGKEWAGQVQGFINAPCHKCGTRHCHATAPRKTKTDAKKLKCEVCQHEGQYPVTWYRYQKDQAVDPYFGFPLWLTVQIHGNILWFYNRSHMDYIRQYVEAKLREDNSRHKYSIITNLPQWVKSAKNREDIIQKIEVLSKTLLSA